MQEECECQFCAELVPPEPGTRQMTSPVFTVEHRNAGDGLQIQTQCESIVSVTCSAAQETGRTLDLLVSHSRTTGVATFLNRDLSG